MDYVALKSEIDSDPLIRGYAGMTDQQVADSLNNTIDRTVNRPPVSGDEMYNVTDATEFDALTDAKKDRWVTFTRSTAIDLQSAANQAMVNHIFGNPSASRTAMINLSTETVSRGVELGFGHVSFSDVENARSI